MNKMFMTNNSVPKYVYIILCFMYSPILSSAQNSDFSNDIGMEFVRVEPGTMIVGKFEPIIGNRGDVSQEIFNKGLEMAEEAYRPGFEVTIEQPYFIGKYEVTQDQWEQVMGDNPSAFQDEEVGGDASNHPVENVTWEEANQFISRLNEMDDSNTYRLPTEFEWEYAARADRETDDIPWSEIRESAVLRGSTTSEVGTMEPNAWGIYDMLGNVWEWVEDYYNEKIFADPTPPVTGEVRVLKGSSFIGDVKNATFKTHAAGPGNGFDVGFRVVMEVSE